MATTKFLNSDRTVWATTYYGAGLGRCIDISMKITEELQVTRTFTEDQLQAALEGGGAIKGLAVPCADDEGGDPIVVTTPGYFPNFEKALQEFKNVAKQRSKPTERL